MHIMYPHPQKPIDHGCSWPAEASLHPALSLRRDLRPRRRSHLRCGKCPSGVGQALCQHPLLQCLCLLAEPGVWGPAPRCRNAILTQGRAGEAKWGQVPQSPGWSKTLRLFTSPAPFASPGKAPDSSETIGALIISSGPFPEPVGHWS